MKKFIALILSLLAVTIAFTQAQVLPIDQLLVNDFKQNSTPDQNKLMPGHFTIGKDLALTADQFIDGYKPVLTPAKESDLKKIITHQSKGGRTHHRYQQTWNGIPVEGQYVLLHEQNGILNSINGAVVAGLSINVHPALSETQALANVRQPSTRYAWEDATMETELQQVTGNPDATYFPKGKLVIFSGDQPPSSNSNYKLAWRFNLYSLTPHDHQQFYVDAQTGVILKTTSLMKHTYVQGSGATNYNGNQTITCNHKHHHYELNSPDIETRKYAGSYNGTGNPFLSLNTTWTGNSAALDVHWGTEKFVEFLNVELGRNGYDGNGKKIRAMVGYPFQNAFWNGYYLGYGVGNNNTLASPTSLDIVGHEYTHAMLDEIVGFQYGGESGAIEEAYSDIFGELIEHFVKGSADWKVGAEITQTAGVPNNLGLRNLMNPNSYNAPSVYKGQHWHNGPSDNWGVHTNSSVYSHWFYLVAFGNGSTINGIGISAATELIYETLFYLQPYSDYYDLRNASAATASSLPQFTPAMLADVDAAWNEVGLGAVSAIEITGIIPAAGATVYGDSTTLIEWDTNLSLSLVDIQYSLNGGVSWLDIVLNHSYNSGQYLWPVSQIYSNTVLVRVMGSVNPTIRGTSNGYFKIKASINFPPVAIDDVLHTKQGYSEYLKVWDNDMDEKELDTMSVSIVNDMSANEGTTYVHPNGTIEITAEASFVGVSSFQYRVCDHGIPVLCDTATVTVNIGEVPRKQLAMHDWGILNLNDTLSENLLENDYLLDPSWTMVGWHPVALTHGNITIDQTTGDYVYLPSSLGRDTICYVVTNGLMNDTAYLNLFVVEDKPGAKDSMDLVILYEMTDGPNWVYKWNLTSPVVFWYGISTNFASRVTSINLSSNGLNGQLHNFSSLDQLDYLDLNDNRLCGQIPDFPNFENVSRLDLQYNQFTGQLPDFSSLIDATWIYLSHNRIEGPLPDFSNLNKVSWLYIDNNHLSGPLTNMTYLDSWLIIHNNQLTFDGIYENYINYNVTLDCNPQAPIPITRLSESLRVYAGGDTTLNTYYWHNHTTNTTHTVQGTNYFTPPNQGEYSCKIENDGIITWILTLNSDTVYYEPSCNISPASHSFVTPCIGDSIEARYLEMQSYSWSFNGTVVGTTPKLAVYESGTYVVSFQDSCMNPMIYDTIHVTIDSTCIQPGDTNQDGIVNHHDLLNIGLHYGTIGPARNGDPEDFFPIKGIDWAQQTNSGLDLKHVDANGDGIINSSDTTIIALHYGKQWSVYTPSVDSAISPIRIVPEIVAAPQGVSGDFTIQYVLENHLNNTINLYGLAFETNIQAPVAMDDKIRVDSIQLPGVSQWLLFSESPDTNIVQLAFTKADLTDAVFTDSTASLFGGTLGTEKDLPTNDTVSIIQISVENVRLTTMNGAFGTGNFDVPVQGAETTILFTEHLAYSLTPTATNCANTGAISVDIIKGTAPFQYQWSNGATTPENTGLAKGSYEVTITDASGSSIVAQTIVEGNDSISNNPTLVHPTNGLANGSISLDFPGGNSNYTVQWSNGITGLSIDGLSPGTYSALVAEGNGCVESFKFVLRDESIIADPISGLIHIYPNPTSGQLTLELIPADQITLSIVDALGRKVAETDYQNVIEGQKEQIDLSNFANGVYYLQIQVNEEVVLKKIVKN